MLPYQINYFRENIYIFIQRIIDLIITSRGCSFYKKADVGQKIKQLLFHLYNTIFSTNSTVFFFSCGGQIIKCPTNADWCSYQQGVDI
jgi:hypothetical protein